MPTGIYVRTEETKKKLSEIKKKNPTKYWLGKERLEMKGNQYGLGYRHTDEAKIKIGQASKGNKNTLGLKCKEETKKKISESLKGRVPWNKGKEISALKGKNNPNWKGGRPKCADCGKQLTHYYQTRCGKCLGKHQQGENSPNWKGDAVGYDALHDWVNKVLGKARKCSRCGKEGTGREIHWANVDHKYRRNVDDFLEMCCKCHIKYDKENNLRR